MAIMRKYDYLVIFNDGEQFTGTVSAYTQVEAAGKVRAMARAQADEHDGIDEINIQER